MVEKCSKTLVKSISSPEINVKVDTLGREMSGSFTNKLLTDENVVLVTDKVKQIVADPSVGDAGRRAIWNSIKASLPWTHKLFTQATSSGASSSTMDTQIAVESQELVDES
eukprot:GHVH01001380.1.p2 GENE.GHVH01001380.1~~GHVH01001380.1.p2  ORF type:complete len:111 (+),score=13.05 GHVH01001380.1:522-854(+)